MAEEPNQVIVHPLVLLNVVDHYNRVAKDTQRRVVGVLLGESDNGRVDCTNSFAVPFEEDSRDKTVWFLDHDFLEEMAHMFKVQLYCRGLSFIRAFTFHCAACPLVIMQNILKFENRSPYLTTTASMKCFLLFDRACAPSICRPAHLWLFV